jgi:peptidoglycan/LPS O-acetylase OafA/YrhL
MGMIPMKNYEQIMDSFKHAQTVMIYAAPYAVDTFFWLGGLLMAFLFVKEMQAKNGRVKWGLVYFHRFWRILPPYMFALFLAWCYVKYLGDGPIFYNADGINPQCKDYWWANMLFINNFIPDGKFVGGCFGWAWYLADDMQFFLITPPILYLYHRFHKVIGWAAIGAMLLCHIICSAVIIHKNDFKVVAVDPKNGPDFMYWYYTKPYCRIGAYAIGVLTGMLLFTFRHYKAKGEVYDPIAFKVCSWLYDSRIVRYIGLAIGLFLINFVIFIQYSAYKSVDDGFDSWNENENTVFMTFDRILFTLGLSLIYLPILFGQFSLICSFLAH